MKLIKYLKNYRFQAIAAPIFKLLECVVDLAVPIITARIIDTGLSGVVAADKRYVINGCLLIVFLGIAGLAVCVISQYFSAAAAVGFSSELRRAAFSHIHSLDFTTRRALGSDTLITRVTGDINQVQNGLNLFLRLVMRSPFIVFGSVIMAFTINARIALVFAAAVPVFAAALFIIMRFTAPLYKLAQSKLDDVVGVTRSTISGARVIRAFGREDAELARFASSSDALARVQTRAGFLSALTNPLSGVIINLAVIGILYFGALEFSVGSITGGAIVALVNYMAQISVELVKLTNLIVQVTRSVACAGRVSSLLNTTPALAYPDAPAVISDAPEAVRFEDVSLTYSGAGGESLSHISFTARRGDVIGIIGGTGSGKSSLVNLIPRFYDCTGGSVYINGAPVSEIPRGELRAAIGVVPQKASLFSGTIRSNLLWGQTASQDTCTATDAELWDALERAQAADFVRAKPLCLDASVEQGGRNFSGGQKQRLTIARALVGAWAAHQAGRPYILILDDSSSALDFATEAALRRSLRGLPGEVTIFIVSQRVASVQSADKILVLDDGQLVGCGTHRELVETCPVYGEINESQYGSKYGA